ncbi:MAG: hypothetical protein AAGK21_00075 [Bacteroidota bacterium]
MPRSYSRPHYAQARTWYRFACWLRRSSCPQFHPHLMKEDALRESFRLRSRSLVLLSQVQHVVPAGRSRLAARVAGGDAYPELVARVAVVDPEDPTSDEVHLFLEEADRTGTHTRWHPLGQLPPEHALWVAPLIRLESNAYGTGPLLRYHVTGGSGTEVHVVISRAHEAAKAWLDWADDRKAWAEARAVAEESPYAYRASYRDTVALGTPYGSLLYATDAYVETDEAE